MHYNVWTENRFYYILNKSILCAAVGVVIRCGCKITINKLNS